MLLVERFDRTPGRRCGYMSAMTAISAGDGDAHDYNELSDQIADTSAAATSDLAEIYRRVAFSVAIHNTDDHLRNTGFLAAPGGWRIAPIFDINPNPERATGRVTSICGATHSPDEAAALSKFAEHCRLGPELANQINSQIASTVGLWREVAGRRGIDRREVRRFEGAFASRD